jgi:hypothetical protein
MYLTNSTLEITYIQELEAFIQWATHLVEMRSKTYNFKVLHDYVNTWAHGILGPELFLVLVWMEDIVACCLASKL